MSHQGPCSSEKEQLRHENEDLRAEKARNADKIKFADFCCDDGGVLSIHLNMNDVFAYACADSEGLDHVDIDLMIPLIAKYGFDACVAYAAVKRGETPIRQSDGFKTAKAEIEAIQALPTEEGYHFCRSDAWWRAEASKVSRLDF